jgi:hypothetical protein
MTAVMGWRFTKGALSSATVQQGRGRMSQETSRRMHDDLGGAIAVAERAEIAARYRQLAGFGPASLNARASHGAPLMEAREQ